MTPWAVFYGSGYMTVVEATDRDNARMLAGNSRVPGDSVKVIREATEGDLAWFGPPR